MLFVPAYRGIIFCSLLITFSISRPAAICKQKYQDLNNLDICSPVFNFKRAIAMVMEQQGRQVCDVLLDQLILPGVGNIIKNEVSIVVLKAFCLVSDIQVQSKL